MSNGGFLLRNMCFRITPVCTTLAAGYSAGNASNNHPSQYIKSTGTTFTVDYNFGSAKAMAGASIHNHNIPVTGSTVKMQFCNDGVTWANDETFTVPAAVVTNGITRYPDMFKIFSVTRTYQYARVSVTVAAGTVQLGEIFIGYAWQFPDRNFHSSFRRIPTIDKSIVGNVVAGLSEHVDYAITFNGVSWTYAPQYEDVVRAKHVVFIPAFSNSECYHGLITQTAFSEVNLDGASSWFGAALSFQGSPVATT